MKKILLTPFLLFAVLSMVACGGGSDDSPDTPAPGGNGRGRRPGTVHQEY